MSSPSASELLNTNSLEALYPKLERLGVGPGWNKPTPSLWKAPRPAFVPAHWDYERAKAALTAAGDLISTELAERRNLILFNPAPGNNYPTVRTLVAAYQMIMPGEWARSHRHTPNALRLVLDAEPGTYTVVDGVKIAMMPGDVLLTPNWSSHGHGNEGPQPGFWIDFLDVPLVQLLEPMFFDPLAEDEAQHEAFIEPPPHRKDRMVFPVAETRQRLEEAAGDPAGLYGRQVELGNPALDTVGLHMMALQPRVRTATCRTTANNIYAVVEGSGATTVDGQRFTWRRGDVIAAPAWLPHFHEAEENAILFRVTDEPVMQRLGFLRTARSA
ncbi:cupin domain-containing protein [Roseomonas chloroacetimidivorans]|uniref:cupin domain-containing protein n=1 Tax=Roseomonas chloroacetimidivorans TaxID=1766656 RepID=UPI003C775075